MLIMYDSESNCQSSTIPYIHTEIEHLPECSEETARNKWLDVSMLPQLRQKYSGKIALLTGCFDIYHEGHEIQLYQSKGYVPDGLLVVGINSDDCVQQLKGPDRPINDVSHRWLKVAKQHPVDKVFVFPDKTAVEVLKALCPDVFITFNEPGKLYNNPQILEIVERMPRTVFRLNVDFAKDPNGNRISTTSILDNKV